MAKPRVGHQGNSSNSPRKFLQIQNESKINDTSISDTRITPTHVKACSTTKNKSEFDSVLSIKQNIKSSNQSPDPIKKKEKAVLRVCSVLDHQKDLKSSLIKNDTSTMVNQTRLRLLKSKSNKGLHLRYEPSTTKSKISKESILNEMSRHLTKAKPKSRIPFK